jgi:hypothetical protein
MKRFLAIITLVIGFTACSSSATAKDNPTPKPPETQWSTISQGNILYTNLYVWHGRIDGKECFMTYSDINAGNGPGEATGLSCNFVGN